MTEKNSSRFSRWFYGEEDPLLGRVEMQPQKEYVEEEASVQERMREHQQLQEKVYDMEHNKKLLLFNKAYRVMAVVFCICLIAICLWRFPIFPGREMPPIRIIMRCRSGILPKGFRKQGR